MLQSIRDVDEKPEGAVNHYVEIAALIERLRANVDALSTCRAFYLSFAYTRVSHLPSWFESTKAQ